jgi:hypothetical protein
MLLPCLLRSEPLFVAPERSHRAGTGRPELLRATRSMGRPPCCDKASVKKGPWTPEEDAKLLAFTSTHGTGNWTTVPQRAGKTTTRRIFISFGFTYYATCGLGGGTGLKRCGKSCRLRYTNYLRPNLKHESFAQAEEELIVTLHAMLGSRWILFTVIWSYFPFLPSFNFQSISQVVPTTVSLCFVYFAPMIYLSN